MRAIVLGAGGHLGNAIVRTLGQQGWQVTAVTRDGKAGANLEVLPVTVVSGASATAHIAGNHLVVDAAAPYALDRLGATGAQFEDAARDRLEGLLDAASRARACFALLSSCTTLRNPQSLRSRSERALIEQLHPYFELKRALQEQVLARRDLDTLIVNPTACFGPWDPKPLPLCFLPLLLAGYVPATNSHPLNLLDVRDVAAFTVAAFERRLFGEPIQLVGHNTTIELVASLACRLEGVQPPRQRVPAVLAAMLAVGNERLAEAGLSPVTYPSLGMLLALDQEWMEPDARQRSLGVRLTPFSRTIVDALAWYRHRGLLSEVTAVDVVAPLVSRRRHDTRQG